MNAVNPAPSTAIAGSDQRPYEPSMEEILASIRRIIADDQSLPTRSSTRDVPPLRGESQEPSSDGAPESPVATSPLAAAASESLSPMAPQGFVAAPQFPSPDVPIVTTFPMKAVAKVEAAAAPTSVAPAPVALAPVAPTPIAAEPALVPAEPVADPPATRLPFTHDSEPYMDEPTLAERRKAEQVEARAAHDNTQTSQAERPPLERAQVKPAYAEPAYIEPAHVEPPHVEPPHVEPPHVEPVHIEPVRAETQPLHAADHENEPDLYFDPPIERDEPRPTAETPAGLFSSHTKQSVSTAFNVLAATRLADNSEELLGLAREMIRPLLKTWLDDNLPSMVERMVRAEIERVARGGR